MPLSNCVCAFVWLGYALTQPCVLTAPGSILEVSFNRLLHTSCVPGLGYKSQCWMGQIRPWLHRIYVILREARTEIRKCKLTRLPQIIINNLKEAGKWEGDRYSNVFRQSLSFGGGLWVCWSVVDSQCSFCCTAEWFSYTYIYYFSYSFLLWFIIRYWIWFPVLYSRTLLFIHGIYIQ